MSIKSKVKAAIRKIPGISKLKVKIVLNMSKAKRCILPNHLVKECENNPDSIEHILSEWEHQNADVAATLANRIDKVLSISGHEDSEQLRKKIKFLYYAYGYSPNEFISYRFDTMKKDDIHLFISDWESVKYGYRMNHLYAMNIFMDKWETYKKYKLYYKRECIALESENDIEKFERYIAIHPVFVKKDVYEACGRGIELIHMSEEISAKDCLKKILTSRRIILEEPVEQSCKLAELNASSVNTVRCFTLRLKSGYVIPWTFMKIGRNGSFVDNGGAGGLLVGIDTKTGICNTDGVDEYGKRFEKHPDSGVVFKGFMLPDWNSMIEICKEMAAKEPKVPWIGWDMAHTDKGWIVIEGNSLSETIGPQVTLLKGVKRELESYISQM